MANRYLFWLRTTAVLQLITAGIHSLSFFRTPIPTNETEKRLFELMTTYPRELGPYFHPSTQDLFTSLSACFTFLFLLGGVTNLYLLQKNLSQQTWKGLTSINLVVFGGTFLVMFLLAFLPPIVLTGMVFVGFCFAYATNHIHRLVSPKN